ncbi:MAG TPA: hypothetical protein VN765_02975 [Candidatus Acidoferrum sp.]|nr:hypothetical protein [Candidatus Acidoferrum sp.]
MAHSIKSSRREGRLDPPAAESVNQMSPISPAPASETAGATPADPQAGLDDSALFRKGILQRYNAPFDSAAPYDRP